MLLQTQYFHPVNWRKYIDCRQQTNGSPTKCMCGCIPVTPREIVCLCGWYVKSSALPTNLHACYNGLHVYAYLNCLIKFLLQHTDAFNDTVADIFNLRYLCSFSVTTLLIIVSSAVSHLVSTSGVCPVIPPSCISVNVSKFLRSLCSCYGLHVGYQCLALEPHALLTYVSIIIITTRAVVMPKKSIDTTVNRGRFFHAQYILT